MDLFKALSEAGVRLKVLVVRNLDKRAVEQSAQIFAKALADSQMLFIPGGFSGGDEPDGSGKFIASFLRNPEISEQVSRLLDQRGGLVGGICNGFQALVKLGLLPYGRICDVTEKSPTLTFNPIGRHQSMLVRTRVCSVLSPWLSEKRVGQVDLLPISHGEGRFVAPRSVLEELQKNGQIATQYVSEDGEATMHLPDNPNGSLWAIEGITSPDGRVFGRMAHSERYGTNLYRNTPYRPDDALFRGAYRYFR
jgi:phosphoribosylformylglycinamidine synthase